MLDKATLSKIHAWRLHERESDLSAELDNLVASKDDETLYDAFYRTLSFGTAGLRGIMGVGTNRMNVHVVAQTMQGIADWINSCRRKGAFSDTAPRVALCRDSRINSERFERVCAEVFAANGIKVLLYPRIEPVPTLSFAIPRLSCAAGVMITSSHNPKQYNGCKIFASDGCQIAGEVADEIATAISRVELFNGPKRIPFDDALADGCISWIGDEMLDRFLKAVWSLSVPGAIAKDNEPSVVYTPLNGTGLELMSRSFEHIGVSDVKVVPEQAKPDGTFPTCPYPNPEFRGALELGLRVCDETHPDVLVATDPDADRMGTAILHGDEYVLPTGNEIGILFMDWLARTHAEAGESLKNCVAVSTIVSTDMLDPIAEQYGFQLRRTLTGFKNIGGQIATLEGHGGPNRWLMGFEESYGYLLGPYVRDKDAITSCTLLVEMVGWYAQRNLDLVGVIERLYQKHGYYLNRTLCFQFPGAEGLREMSSLMSRLRDENPSSIAGSGVTGITDYLTGDVPMRMTGGRSDDPAQVLPPSDVMEWRLEDGRKILVRPSGTEPEVKCYLFSRGNTRSESSSGLDSLETAVHESIGA